MNDHKNKAESTISSENIRNQQQNHDCCGEHDHGQDHDHEHPSGNTAPTLDLKGHWDLLLSLFILVTVLVLEYGLNIRFPFIINLIIHVAAYLLAGREVLNLAYRKAKRGDFFNEFVLMSVATLGAFYIGEFSEGVAVMFFYQIGEWFQDSAVMRAKHSIKALLDIRPEEVRVLRNGSVQVVHPREVNMGESIQVKPGEKVALDSMLLSKSASFNTAALTGESKPDTKYQGEAVLAGMINLNTVAEAKVTALFRDSKLSKILEMVQDATARKSQTQLFISRFAKVYTPVVFFLALAVFLVPYFFTEQYNYQEWLYRALVFLVISCPCALVVSIPLGYFGGIGLASGNGILFKGGNFLDVMAKVKMVVMDKTGTLTKGVFKVQEVSAAGLEKEELVRLAAALEKNSTHPVARAVTEYAGEGVREAKVNNMEEIAGMGLKGTVDGKEMLAGNLRLLQKYAIPFPEELNQIRDTVVVVAIDHTYAGYLTIADEIKEDAAETIRQLHAMNIKTVMLSGDKQTVVDGVAKFLGIDMAFGDLLPDGKTDKVEQLKKEGHSLAFVGDGVNDAPVVALADAGIAMGGLGSDATIETADVVIQNDQPSKIVAAIKAGRITRNIVWQNIILAMSVKIIVLALGAGGVAGLWEAVIADVGVALLAILNAVRIQRMKL